MSSTTETHSPLRLPLFEGYGMELEYMIVAKDSLNVLPISDKVMYAVSGAYLPEVEREDISWSNELALHVIEFKTTGPVQTLNSLQFLFQEHVKEVNEILKSFNAQLMPTAMHPWMNPYQEMRLWPHEYNPIYEAYNRIFDCRGHGWANLQSAHINLPFSNDEEFSKLHAAIRVLLPILPALAASSPIVERKLTKALDSRLLVYRDNAKSIPSITGKIIPEVCYSQKEYEDNILKIMYKDISPLDPDNILQFEWLNSRGAIARFDRFTIEIRILDVQECPLADIAISQAIVATLMALTKETWATIDQLNAQDLNALHELLLLCIKDGEDAIITEKSYLNLFGYPGAAPCKMGELWHHLVSSLLNAQNTEKVILHTLETILKHGPLARRIIKKWIPNATPESLKAIYQQLCQCLESGQMFI